MEERRARGLTRKSRSAARFERYGAPQRPISSPRPRRIESDLDLALGLQRLGLFEEASDLYFRALESRPASAELLRRLGDALRPMGRLSQAEECYRLAIEREPDEPSAHHGLGLVLHDLNRLSEAAEAYRTALSIDPGQAQARFLLSSITGEDTPAIAPRELVEDLFDLYAPRFDSHLRDALGYSAPERLRELYDSLAPGAASGAIPGSPDRGGRRDVLGVRSMAVSNGFARAIDPTSPGVDHARLEGDPDGGRSRLDVLDLGCGTGLCGARFRDVARRLVGVDLSSGMLEQARRRGVYDELRQEDIRDALRRDAGAHDLILAADVFVYVGDLAPVFHACRQALRPGGAFLFTTEHEDVASYAVAPRGRFVHAPDYVTETAEAAGFTLLARHGFPLRRERDEAVPGDLFALSIPAK